MRYSLTWRTIPGLRALRALADLAAESDRVVAAVAAAEAHGARADRIVLADPPEPCAGKDSYESAAAAREALARIQRRTLGRRGRRRGDSRRVAPYECACGRWHLGGSFAPRGPR